MKPLKPGQSADLAKASRRPINQAMVRIERYARGGNWLPTTNRYRTETVDRLARDDIAGSIRPRQLADYIAASAPIHCLDGWEYLGRALAAHLAGHPSIARHLGYYAELRGSIALLATQGIGIFNNKHFVTESNGRVLRAVKGRGTHEVAWLALENWAATPEAASVLSDAFAPLRVPMGSWISELPRGGSWAAQGRQWLATWGLDLQMFDLDRAARNVSSYRPTTLSPTSSVSPEDAARFLEEFWLLLEPEPISSFATFDRYLLRRSVETAFRSTQGRTPRQAPRLFRGAVETMVQQYVVPGAGHDDLVEFICRENLAADPWPIDLAERTDGPASPTHHQQVMSRALLLLRAATGACRLALDDARVDFDNLAFWWGPVGQRTGLWDIAPPGSSVLDSWLDVAAAVDDVRDWREHSSGSTSRHLLTSSGTYAANLYNAELVPLWNFAA